MAWIASVWRRWSRRLSGRAFDPGSAQTAMEPVAAFGRQALRAIVGRKRRHDLVRRRELEELRQWRRQGLLPTRSARPGLALDVAADDPLDDPVEREKTLEKIDAIEAQMARYWWRGKVTGATAQAAGAAPVPTDAMEQAGDTHARTEPPLPADASDFAPTRAATLPPQEDTEFLPTQMALTPTIRTSGPAAVPVAAESGDEAELREAALLWARGQSEAAMNLLQAALAEPSEGSSSSGLRAALDDARRALDGHGLRLTGSIPDLDVRASSAEDRLVLDCAGWSALDFAAAGSILNWVQARQGAGRRVELRDVRPLLAALFAVLELDSLARITPAA